MKPAKQAPAPVPVKTVDPFGYWPWAESRIAGIGGGASAPDPTYAFHTAYTEIGGGVVVCTLRFERLEATMGMITVRVNGRAPDPGARAETIRTWTADLRDVAESDGVLELSFQSSAGTAYAVLGNIYQECDARARSFTIDLQLSPDIIGLEGQQAVRKSLFGRRVFRRTAKLEVRARTTLADPVSQACTAAQFDEPTYARWAAEMQQPPMQDRRQWAEVYVLQALERYGMLRPGAHGIGFGVEPWAGPAVMAARGCRVSATSHASSSETEWKARSARLAALFEQLRFPSICADDVFDRQVETTSVNLKGYAAPSASYDFAWSINTIQHLGSIAEALDFVRSSIGALSMGGLAVHTTLFNATSKYDTVDNASTVLLRRQDLERIAVDLVSRGHYVAQLNFDLGDPPLAPEGGGALAPRDPELAAALDEFGAIPFGLIVRRGER